MSTYHILFSVEITFQECLPTKGSIEVDAVKVFNPIEKKLLCRWFEVASPESGVILFSHHLCMADICRYSTIVMSFMQTNIVCLEKKDKTRVWIEPVWPVIKKMI